MRFSSCSKVDKVREFIKNVYVDKRYAGGKTPAKPPRDLQVIFAMDNRYHHMIKFYWSLLSISLF